MILVSTDPNTPGAITIDPVEKKIWLADEDAVQIEDDGSVMIVVRASDGVVYVTPDGPAMYGSALFPYIRELATVERGTRIPYDVL